MPPMMPGSAVSVRYFSTRSSAATAATPSGMPMPRLTTPPGGSSKAQRRAMILRSSSGERLDPVERHPLPAREGVVVGRGVGLQVVLGRRHHDAVDEHAGDLDLARVSESAAAMRSTCAITSPREFLAAIAIARLSRVSASRSMVMLPAGSAVVPRTSATLIGKVL